MEENLAPGPVKGLIPPQLPDSVEVTSKVAAFVSAGGLGLLVAIALGSMMAGLGVAAFRESNAIWAAGVSLFLPVIGPILFLVKPKVEYEYEDEYDEDEEYEYEEAETPAGATMTDTGGAAVAGMIPKAKKMSFAQAGPRKAGLKPQSWTRGEIRFDRSFFQNNFPNYFKTVLGAAERGARPGTQDRQARIHRPTHQAHLGDGHSHGVAQRQGAKKSPSAKLARLTCSPK